MKRFLFFLGIFCMTLGWVDTAKAGPVSATLTAKFEKATDLGGGVSQFTTQTVRITQKDLLVLLRLLYVFPVADATLHFDYDGSGFNIRDSNGTVLHLVGSDAMSFTSTGNLARSGIYNPNPGQKTKIKSTGNMSLNFDAGVSDVFTLTGLMDQNHLSNFSTGAFNNTHSFSGTGFGTISDQDCVITGKIKLKTQGIVP